ncbi:MAG: glycosyltransferase [Nitrospirota bacterium]
MTGVRYRIAGLSAYRDELRTIMDPLLAGAARLGHEARALAAGEPSRVLAALRAKRVDFCLLTGRTAYYLAQHAPELLRALQEEQVPSVALWYDNPLRYLDVVAAVYADNLLLLTTADTKCAEELRRLGFARAAYSPGCCFSPNFQPGSPTEDLRCELSFAGGYMSRDYFETRYLPQHFRSMHEILFGDCQDGTGEALRRLIEEFLALRRNTRRHVDVYEYLRDRLAPLELRRYLPGCSHLLMHYQKTLEREQLFDAVTKVPDATLHCYGGADVVLRKGDVMASPWKRVVFHPSLDQHTDLGRLFVSTGINLGLSQFPRAVHRRYFESAACGGFMIGEYKDDIEGLFDVGREIVCFRDLDELPDLIRHYRKRDAERARIGRLAHERSVKQHQPYHRVQALVPIIARELERFRDLYGARGGLCTK